MIRENVEARRLRQTSDIGANKNETLIVTRSNVHNLHGVTYTLKMNREIVKPANSAPASRFKHVNECIVYLKVK